MLGTNIADSKAHLEGKDKIFVNW